MAAKKPSVIVRMGSHSEKDYLEKTIEFLDGIIIGANLIEATPGATASLLVRFGGRRKGVPLYVDPMTYAYGTYVDAYGRRRNDLDWIKSDQKVGKDQGGKQRVVRRLKRSYRKLSEELGGPIEDAATRGSAVMASHLEDDTSAANFCRSVLEYQQDRLVREFRDDPDYASFAEDVPVPSAVFAPYFYIESQGRDTLRDLNLRLARLSVELGLPVPVHAVILADVEFIDDKEFMEKLGSLLPATGVRGVWFWFSRFDEHAASASRLMAFRSLVQVLDDRGLAVFNMHGGFLSLAMSKYGLSGISHGIGYGEQKDVMPVIGQSTPTVRYYLPDVHRRLGVPDIQRCFTSLGIRSVQDFYAHVCDCVVCQGVVNSSIDGFAAFGAMYRSRPDAKRPAQTPAAAKRCRFHFLLRRLAERDAITGTSLSDIVKQIDGAARKWGRFEWLSESCRHLGEWKLALE